jgi:hypothetical protein
VTFQSFVHLHHLRLHPSSIGWNVRSLEAIVNLVVSVQSIQSSHICIITTHHLDTPKLHIKNLSLSSRTKPHI